MQKKLLLFVISFLLSSTVFSIDIELETFIRRSRLFKSNAIVFKNNIELLSVYKFDIYKINILTKEMELVAKINPEDVPYKRYSSRIFKANSLDEYFIEYDSLGRDPAIFFHLKDNVIQKVTREMSSLDFFKELIIGGIHDNYKMKLLGNSYYSFDGKFSYSLPYVIDKSSDKKYFTMNDNDFKVLNVDKIMYESRFEKFYRNKEMPTISDNKFVIAFLGWSVESMERGNAVGDYSGLFVFRIIYDGLVNDDSTIYDFDKDGLLVEKELLISDTDVKVKDIKQVGDFKYYHIEYGEDKSGYILEDNIDIK